MVDMGPGGSLSTQQLYAPPAKPEEQKENYTAVQAVNEAGQPVVYMVNKYNPRDYYELGGAIQKGSKGSSAGGREAAPQDAYAGRTRNVMDEVAKYFPIQDSSGKPVDWRNYDPTKGHVVSSETIFTGPRLGSLPTFMQSQEGADLKAQLGQFSGTTFLSELVAAKGRGATFGALSNEEKKAIEEAATIAGDPTISNERRIQAMQRLDAEIEQAVGNWERRSGSTQKRPQGRTTSSGVSWSID